MIKLLALSFLTVAAAFAAPCDGNPRVNNGLTLICKAVDQPILAHGAYESDPHAEVRVQVLPSVYARAFYLVIQYKMNGDPNAGRVVEMFPVVPGTNGTVKTVRLPYGATAEIISVEQLTTNNSAGFVN